MTYTRNFDPYQYLPRYAKLAIERIDCDSSLRTAAKLDELIDAYAKTYGETPDEHARASAQHIAARRFWNFTA